jgi:DNA-binding MarR family transcriptional regulator
VSISPGTVGELALALAALLGVGAGAIGMFVLRVEYADLVRRVRSLEDESHRHRGTQA